METMLKRISSLLFSYVLMLFCACTDLSGVENDLKDLTNRVNSLEDVITLLKKAYDEGKKINTVVPTVENDGWVITFSENMSITVMNTNNSETLIKSIEEDGNNGVITLELRDGSKFKFNLDLSYPAGISVLIKNIRLTTQGSAKFEVNINPSNAASYDESSFLLNLVNKTRASYVTTPSNYKIELIEPIKNEDGEIQKGKYYVIIVDLGVDKNYLEYLTVVLSSKNGKGDNIYVSSDMFAVEWYNGDDFYDFMIGDVKGVFGDDNSIIVRLPKGTDVSSIKPIFKSNGTVSVAGKTQVSGVSSQNFTSSKEYIVTDANGKVKKYKVSVLLI